MIITPITNPYNVTLIEFADSPYDVVELDRVLRVDATNGNIIINLKKLNPLVIKKALTDTTENTITLTPDAGQTIGGTSSWVLRASGENTEILLDETGTNWEVFN